MKAGIIVSMVCLAATLQVAGSASIEAGEVAGVLSDVYAVEDVLWRIQEQFAGLLPSDQIYLHQDKTVHPVDWSTLPEKLKQRMHATLVDGFPVYELRLITDPVSRDTIFYNDRNVEVYRIVQSADQYDPYLWWKNRGHAFSYLEIDVWNLWIFDYAHTGASIRMVPVSLHAAFMEELAYQKSQEQLTPPSMMMSSSSAEVTNLWVGISSSTNGKVELELRWPTNYLDRICLFCSTNLVNWHLTHTNVVTTGLTNYFLLDPVVPMPMKNFFRSGNADQNSDEDGLVDSYEVMLYGTNPQDPDSDDDGFFDDWEVAHGIDPLDPENPLDIQNLPDLDIYEPTTNYPAGFAAFNPPVSNGIYVTPMIAEWTRSADQNETIVMTSVEEIEALAIYSTSTNAVAANWFTNGYGHAQMPADGMKMLWPITATETGLPIRVNNTIAWWLGPDLCDTNEQFSIYGNSLSPYGETTHAYIDGYGWITNVWGNNQKATFDVPDNLSNGTYTVYAHNGLGGKYGWGKGHDLTIAPLVDYTQSTITNITSGDFGDLKANLYAATPNTTVIVPAGTYYFTSEVRIPHPSNNPSLGISDNIWLKGAGTGETVFAVSPSYVDSPSYEQESYLMDCGYKYANGELHTITGLKMTGITFDRGTVGTLRPGLFKISGYNCRISNCEFTDINLPYPNTEGGSDIVSINGHLGAPVWFTSNTLVQTVRANIGTHVQWRFNEHYGRNDYLGKTISMGASIRSDISDNFATHLEVGNLDKSCQGRFVVLQALTGFYDYVGNNTTLDYKPHPSSYNRNAGEQILFENTNPDKIEGVTTATVDTVTSPTLGALDSSRRAITIVKGKGFGQTRPIESISSSTATLVEPWLIPPDSNSDICIHRSGWRLAAVDNYLDGIKDAVNNNTASAAVSLYGGPSETLVVGNTGHELEDGFACWAFTSKKDKYATEYNANPAYFNVFEENSNIDSYKHQTGGGIGYMVTSLGNPYPSAYTPVVAVFGTVFRNNTVTNVDIAIAPWANHETFSANMSVFEFNTGTATNIMGTDNGVHTYTNENSITIL